MKFLFLRRLVGRSSKHIGSEVHSVFEVCSPPPSRRSRSVSLSGPKRDPLNINSKEKLPMEVWTSENGLGIFASSLTSEKRKGDKDERKGRGEKERAKKGRRQKGRDKGPTPEKERG